MFTPHYRLIETRRVAILSDIHLGAAHSNVRATLKILRRERFDILILLGDLFDGSKLERLKGRHWAVLSRLRKLSKNREIIYLTGNHCFLPARFMSQLLGLSCFESYGVESGSIKIYFVHGDAYDWWCGKRKWITKLGTWAKHLVDLLDPKGRHVARLGTWIDRWGSLATTVRYVAQRHARLLHADWIVCGHTHVAEVTPPEGDQVGYANSGSLLDEQDTYLILENGKLSLHRAGELRKKEASDLSVEKAVIPTS